MQAVCRFMLFPQLWLPRFPSPCKTAAAETRDGQKTDGVT